MKVLGITDTVTVCDCCGRKNLKRVVALDTGEGIVYYGTDCAAKAMTRNATAASRLNKTLISVAKDVATINKWIAGYGLDKAASGVTHKLGYMSELKGDVLRVKMLEGEWFEFRA